MNYGVLPLLFSSQLHNFGNMNEASSSSSFPHELADVTDANKADFYSNDFRLRPEMYNYNQQAGHRSVHVPLRCPSMMDYHQSAGVVDDLDPMQQPLFSPTNEFLDYQCHQGFRGMENTKKRMNDVRDQKVVNKKLAHHERMRGIGCVREKVPMRRSQKLADKITTLQKLVSPYGKTDTASVLQEAHISINLLHDQIQKLLQKTQTSTSNGGPLQFQNKEAETGLCNRGLCLVPVSTLQINSLCYEKQNFMSGN